MVVGIAEGYGALKAALEIVKGLKDIHDQVQLNSAVIELQGKILDAQEATQGARDRLKELESELLAMKQWEKQASRYQLKDFGENTLAYELKAEHAENEPIHLVCPTCFQKQERALLQFKGTYSGRRRFDCNSCKGEFDLGVYRTQSMSVNRRGIV